MASFRSEAETFSGMSGMVEGHGRHATGPKLQALARGVGSFVPYQGLTMFCCQIKLKRFFPQKKE